MLVAVPLVELARVTDVKVLRGAVRVYPLLTKPMAPNHNSSALVVVAVVPVTAAALLPVAVFDTSTAEALRIPLYSATTAAAWTADARLIVIAVPAAVTFGAYQISVVVPAVPVEDATRDHTAPVCVIEETRLAVVPLVEIVATSVLPFTGAVLSAVITTEVVAVALPPVVV